VIPVSLANAYWKRHYTERTVTQHIVPITLDAETWAPLADKTWLSTGSCPEAAVFHRHSTGGTWKKR
jgi:hypothetical protein